MTPRWDLQRQRQVLQHGQALEDVRRLKLAADAQAGDRCSGGSARQVVRPLERATLPDVGRVLPVMTSSSVVLPAPLGPMTTRSSPCSSAKFRSVQRLEAAERDGHVLDLQDARFDVAVRRIALPLVNVRA